MSKMCESKLVEFVSLDGRQRRVEIFCDLTAGHQGQCINEAQRRNWDAPQAEVRERHTSNPSCGDERPVAGSVRLICYREPGHSGLHRDSGLMWGGEPDAGLDREVAIRQQVAEALDAPAMSDPAGLVKWAAGVISDLTATRALLTRYQSALVWCKGSDDFNEGGKAREGWMHICAPLMDQKLLSVVIGRIKSKAGLPALDLTTEASAQPALDPATRVGKCTAQHCAFYVVLDCDRPAGHKGAHQDMNQLHWEDPDHTLPPRFDERIAQAHEKGVGEADAFTNLCGAEHPTDEGFRCTEPYGHKGDHGFDGGGGGLGWPQVPPTYVCGIVEPRGGADRRCALPLKHPGHHSTGDRPSDMEWPWDLPPNRFPPPAPIEPEALNPQRLIAEMEAVAKDPASNERLQRVLRPVVEQVFDGRVEVNVTVDPAQVAEALKAAMAQAPSRLLPGGATPEPAVPEECQCSAPKPKATTDLRRACMTCGRIIPLPVDLNLGQKG